MSVITFDMGRARQWLNTDNDAGIAWWDEIGLTADYAPHDHHPNPLLPVGDFVSTTEQLLYTMDAYDAPGWNVRDGVRVGLWPTSDSDGADGGCLLTVSLPGDVRLASLHQTPADFAPAPDVAPVDGSIRTGVEAGLDALAHVAAVANDMVEAFEAEALAYAARALHATIVAELEQPDDPDRSWNGGDLVDLVTGWLTRHGVKVE